MLLPMLTKNTQEQPILTFFVSRLCLFWIIDSQEIYSLELLFFYDVTKVGKCILSRFLDIVFSKNIMEVILLLW